MEKLLDEMARVQDQIEATNAWELDRQLEIAMDAMNLPPGDADVANALRRRAAPRGPVQDAAAASPTCCCSTSRRTISTPKRCLARAAPGRISPARSSP